MIYQPIKIVPKCSNRFLRRKRRTLKIPDDFRHPLLFRVFCIKSMTRKRTDGLMVITLIACFHNGSAYTSFNSWPRARSLGAGTAAVLAHGRVRGRLFDWFFRRKACRFDRHLWRPLKSGAASACGRPEGRRAAVPTAQRGWSVELAPRRSRVRRTTVLVPLVRNRWAVVLVPAGRIAQLVPSRRVGRSAAMGAGRRSDVGQSQDTAQFAAVRRNISDLPEG